MASYGHAGDLQAIRDLARREPAPQEFEDFRLAPRQFHRRPPGDLHAPPQPASPELVGERAEQLARDRRLAALDRLQRTADPRSPDPFEHVARRSRSERVDQLLRIRALHEKNGSRGGRPHPHARQHRYATFTRTAVHDADVRPRTQCRGRRGLPVGRFRDDDEAALLEQCANAGTNARRRSDDERVPETGDRMRRDVV